MRLKADRDMLDTQLALPLNDVDQKVKIDKSGIEEMRKDLLKVIEMVKEL